MGGFHAAMVGAGNCGVFAIPIVGQSSHSPYPDESKDAFAALRRQWARNLHDKQIDASVAEYMADAEFINPEGSRVHGTAELRHLFENRDSHVRQRH